MQLFFEKTLFYFERCYIIMRYGGVDLLALHPDLRDLYKQVPDQQVDGLGRQAVFLDMLRLNPA